MLSSSSGAYRSECSPLLPTPPAPLAAPPLSAVLTLVQRVVLAVLGGREDGHQHVGAPPQRHLTAHGINGLQGRAKQVWE